MNLNRKGYMLVEIIVSSVLAMSIAYYLLNLTYKFKNTNEDIYQSYNYMSDKISVTKNIMNDLNNKRVKIYKAQESVGSSDVDDVVVKLVLNSESFDDDPNHEKSECDTKECRKLRINKVNKVIEYGKFTIDGDGRENFEINDISYYIKEINNDLVIEDLSFHSEGDEHGFSVTVNISISSIYNDEDYSIKLILSDNDGISSEILLPDDSEESVVPDGSDDITPPQLEILPYSQYTIEENNEKKINIKTYDDVGTNGVVSGLKIGSHNINYLFTDRVINNCDELIADSNSKNVEFEVISGNEYSDNYIEILVPSMKVNTPTKLNLYVCSKNLVDNSGNLFDGLKKDELKVYDLEKTKSTALFYLPSVLNCTGDSCSLGNGMNFFANGVSLSPGIKFYYLWNQPLNLFSMVGTTWPFVGAYVAFDDIKNLFMNEGDELYNEALNGAEIIFNDGNKYVFGYIPLSNMGTCLTTIPCK